jgi:hypothetical protein
MRKKWTYYNLPERPSLEILGPGQESQRITTEFKERQFTFGDAQSILENETMLSFFTAVSFLDSFNRRRKVRCDFVVSVPVGIFQLVSREAATL